MVVAVIGQGYVGLPLALAALGAGHTVYAVECNADRLESLRAGRSYIADVSSSALADAIGTNKFLPVPDLDGITGIDTFVVAVPTPVTDAGAPDLSLVDGAVDAIAGSVADGALVVIESTLYPGAIRDHVAPYLEKASGRRAGEDVYLAYSPERIDPGRSEVSLSEVPKLVSGVCYSSAVLAQKFYETIFRHVQVVSSCEVAEFAKLLENTFRYVNIAFANELARAARDASINFREVVAAAASKPYGFMPFYHGPGVGGHCLPNNVRYLNHSLRQLGKPSSMLMAATEINESAPGYVVDRLADSLARRNRPLAGSSVMVVGLAYKAGVGDVRNSPALNIIELLRDRGADVRVADPLAGDEVRRLGLTPVSPTAGQCRDVDAVIIATDQDDIDYGVIAREAALVLDCRGRIEHPAVEQL